eukprot:Protomagalhaensia_sp_Gyna_25__3775@NODE_3392_length_592_cov_149_036166_g2846_i0_p1_GENE_NODE_3392_length_592_cov_149_036166_g2846_i0NODE_3392_length_592_cov_149_036166_g2846_i0_p1_ORF_typecomplete_len115_score18_06_NODE_3392_length_592_cov_149_036166_g2846_i0122466
MNFFNLFSVICVIAVDPDKRPKFRYWNRGEVSAHRQQQELPDGLGVGAARLAFERIRDPMNPIHNAYVKPPDPDDEGMQLMKSRGQSQRENEAQFNKDMEKALEDKKEFDAYYD